MQVRLSLLFRCKGEVLFGQQYGQRHEANQSSSKIYFLFRIFSVRFRFFRSLIGKQGGKSLNTGGDLYGILRALSDEPINRQRQKRSFRFICRLSIQYIRCVEQRAAYRCLHSVLRARTAFAPRPGKTLHRTVLFPRLRVPFDLTKHREAPNGCLCVWCRWWDSPLKSSFACTPCCAPGLLSLPGRAKRSTGPFCFPGFESRLT